MEKQNKAANAVTKEKIEKGERNIPAATEIEVQAEIVKPKKRTTSVSYTLKALAKNNMQIKKAGLISEEDFNTLEEIRKKATRLHIEASFDL